MHGAPDCFRKVKMSTLLENDKKGEYNNMFLLWATRRQHTDVKCIIRNR